VPVSDQLVQARFAVDGAELAYDARGSGPVVIQAHGMSSSRAQELELGLDFSPVADARRLVRYDARGHGESTGRPVPEDYAWSALAGDLLALRRDLVGDGAVDGIGSSMGCGTLLHAAVREPGAFRRLVLVIPPTAWESRTAQSGAYRAGADAIQAQGIATFVALMQTQMLPPVLAQMPGLSMIPQVSEALFPSVLRGAALSDLPDPALLATLTQPVLILPWADDPVHPESTANALLEILPQASLVRPAETPEQVRRWGTLAAEFLS
jgi:pimeloyl-ACP methyl ester carboxylesterase